MAVLRYLRYFGKNLLERMFSVKRTFIIHPVRKAPPKVLAAVDASASKLRQKGYRVHVPKDNTNQKGRSVEICDQNSDAIFRSVKVYDFGSAESSGSWFDRGVTLVSARLLGTKLVPLNKPVLEKIPFGGFFTYLRFYLGRLLRACGLGQDKQVCVCKPLHACIWQDYMHVLAKQGPVNVWYVDLAPERPDLLCELNLLLAADEIHVYWDSKAIQPLMLGMVFATQRLLGTKVVLINKDEVEVTTHKSFNNLVHEMDGTYTNLA